MVQGSSLARPAVTGTEQRPVNPSSSADAERPSAVPEAVRTAPAGENSAAIDEVATLANASGARAFTRTRELSAALIRGEAVLQIAQEAMAAMEVTYAGMRGLADTARNPDLTESERATLDTAFRTLKPNIDAIIETAQFDGERILAAGAGRDGAYGLSLSALGMDRLIPAIPLSDLRGPGQADLLTAEAARLASEGAEGATRIVRRLGDVVGSQQAALRQIHASRIDSNQRPGDYVGSLGAPENAGHLSRMIADFVFAGGTVPFEASVDRMRDVLTRYHSNSPHSPNNQALPVGQTSPWRGPASGIADVAAPYSKAVVHDGGAIHQGPYDGTGQAIVPRDDGGSANRGSRDFEIPSPPVGNEPLVREGAPAVRPEIVPAPAGSSKEHWEAGATDMVPRLHGFAERYAGYRQPLSTGAPGESPVGQVVPSGPDSTPAYGAIPPRGMTAAAPVGIDQPAETPPAPFLATELAPNRAGNQAAAEGRQIDPPRIAELDPSRRAAGPVHQVRDSDARPDAGLTIVKTSYEAPAERTEEFAEPAPVAPGGVMAQLLRADNMLHVADAAIEQMDLHLDYMRGLAGEAAAHTSRDRGALDEIFQAVKTNIVDTLARTTEARGERILAGGDGPAGAYVIRLSPQLSPQPSGSGTAEEAHDIAIPSMRIADLSPGLHDAHIRDNDAAMAAVDGLEAAGADLLGARDIIADARTLIRRLISMEVARHTSRAPLAASALGL